MTDRAAALRQRLEQRQQLHPPRLTTAVRAIVVEILGQLGAATDHELVDVYRDRVDDHAAPPASPGLIRTARLQLLRDHLVEPTGERAATPYGRTAKVWRLTPGAAAEYRIRKR